MISDELEKTLQRSKACAESFQHEFMTIEHLLFSMIDDLDVKEIFNACNVDAELLKKDLENKKSAKLVMEKINNKIFTVKNLVTENKDLYGSIKPTEISKLINGNEKIEIKPSLIQPLKEIKSLGTFRVKIDLHSEVQAEIRIKVESQEENK